MTPEARLELAFAIGKEIKRKISEPELQLT
jgi:hypothetical protein